MPEAGRVVALTVTGAEPTADALVGRDAANPPTRPMTAPKLRIARLPILRVEPRVARRLCAVTLWRFVVVTVAAVPVPIHSPLPLTCENSGPTPHTLSA